VLFLLIRYFVFVGIFIAAYGALYLAIIPRITAESLAVQLFPNIPIERRRTMQALKLVSILNIYILVNLNVISSFRDSAVRNTPRRR
jgi:hypothetical protein